MAQIDSNLINTIVGRVLSELERQQIAPKAGLAATVAAGRSGVFEDVDPAVAATVEAQKIWARSPIELRTRVIEALRKAMHDHADEFARMARDETGMGRLEDKILKHHNAANSTPGIEDLVSHSWSGDKGLTVEDYAPYGVVAAITPSTHPIPVLLNSIIIIIAPGNGAVFNVHPAAKKVSAYAMQIFNQAIEKAGGPANLVTLIREPTMESANRLFRHPAIALIAATGGPALVQAAFASGKKVIAAGPGNPPVLVDATAHLDEAARHIIDGAAFDNNILCIAEKEVFVLEPVFNDFTAAMDRAGAVRLSAEQIESLTSQVFSRNNSGHWIPSRDFVGKNASVLARAVGISLSDDVRLLYGETGSDHPFVQEEQMMPFMPVVCAQDLDEAIEMAITAEHGYRHTAMIHSNDLKTITRFSKAIDTSIVVVNGPSFAGNGPPAGEGYFSHTISSPTGEGVCTPKDFARVRRICTFRSLRMT
ncbi:MAG: aldehyde dehydrogenase EutE [Acidobacteriota bacterium]|nr:MAG: aldehyde dehydrogenase EutE [Acidobacteriota bacterium]